jgi:hypothetical protein
MNPDRFSLPGLNFYSYVCKVAEAEVRTLNISVSVRNIVGFEVLRAVAMERYNGI